MNRTSIGFALFAAIFFVWTTSIAQQPAQAPIPKQQSQTVEAPSTESRELTSGVQYIHMRRTTPAGEPLSIHVLEMSRKVNTLRVEAVRAQSAGEEMRREKPSEMAARLARGGTHVVAVVNGDYDMASPYLGISDGLDVSGGFVFTTGKPSWPAMAVFATNEPVIDVPQTLIRLEARKRWWRIGAINKPLGSGHGAGARLYTRDFRAVVKSDKPFRAFVIGKISRGLPLQLNKSFSGRIESVAETSTEFAIPTGKIVIAEPLSDNSGMTSLRVGDKVKIEVRVSIGGRKDIRDVIGGFPVLVQGGKKYIMGGPSPGLSQRHPRTAVCYNEKSFIFAVVDGRQPKLSVGMTLEDLAELMVSLGCQTAMNTDGGGSSVMAIALPPDSSNPTSSMSAQSREAQVNTVSSYGLRVVNSPSDGAERGRGNAWVILQRKP